ncbi:MAG: DUF2760 domain-containing protein [Aeromonadaceae bacterium]|nr:DUF2760 domain-containing protein [Aeromonadaceae bacterium]
MSVSLFGRLRLSLHVLFNAQAAQRLLASQAVAAEPVPASVVPTPVAAAAPQIDRALQLLALLQQQGRLLDFIQEDLTGFDDAQIGAAARVVHQGLGKVIREHVTLAPVAQVGEGQAISLPAGFDSQRYRLVGNVSGQGPFNGTLLHKGWQASAIQLPQTLPGYDASVLAPAEVEV